MYRSISAFAAVTCLCAGAAFAGPYVGGDLQYGIPLYTGTLFTSQPQHVSGGNVHAGWRRDRISLEAGWFTASGETADDRLSVSGPTLDALAYFPIGGSRAEWFLAAGGALFQATATAIGNSTSPSELPFSKQNTSWRAGGGIEFGLTRDVTIRFTGRYEDFSFGGRMKGGATLATGLNFKF